MKRSPTFFMNIGSHSKGHSSCRAVIGLIAALVFAVFNASGVVLDSGIDPAHLGKGDWIFDVASSTNQLGGNVAGVTSLNTLMAYEKNQGINFLVVRAGDGSTLVPSSAAPQFTSSVVNAAHAAGLKIFGTSRSYGTNIPGELNIITNVLKLGADGYVVDAESEWESLPSNTVAAVTLLASIKTMFPTRFLAHSPFLYIGSHPAFPYIQFGFFCDAVMPQAYWTSYLKTPATVVSDMDNAWTSWQNSLTGTNRNAIKPLVPIAQGWSPGTTTDQITTGAQITQFSAAMNSDASPASTNGYNGVVYFRAELHSADMWAGITGVTFPAAFSLQPATNITVTAGQNAIFGTLGAGTPPPTYQWRFNSTNISGATSTGFSVLNAQPAQAGNYTVVISNSVNSLTSSVTVLVVQSIPPTITSAPASQSVKLGSNAVFNVAASGTAPLNYQWFFNGTNISGATTNSYTVTNARTTNAGNYSVKAANGGGTNTSTNANLTIIMPSAPHIDHFSPVVSGQLQLNLTGDAGTTYIIESSTNLATWTSIATNTNTAGTILFTNPNPNNTTVFYRLQVAP